jgi:hypothetical protein
MKFLDTPSFLNLLGQMVERFVFYLFKVYHELYWEDYVMQ